MPGSQPSIIVVMGVSSSGKSTIGALLAGRLHWDFEDADWFHPDSNVEKMHAGIPLTDEDRWPWLEAIAPGSTAPARRRPCRARLLGAQAQLP